MFQGMESLFHGFEHGGGGYDRGFGAGGGGGETVVNNYYDDDRSDRGERDRDDTGRNDSSFYNPSDDASRDTGAQFADTGNGRDFAAADDSGSFDNSGGFDNDAGFDDSSSDNGDLGGGF